MELLPDWWAAIAATFALGAVGLRWLKDNRALESIKQLHDKELQSLVVQLAEKDVRTLNSVIKREQLYIDKIDRLQKEVNEFLEKEKIKGDDNPATQVDGTATNSPGKVLGHITNEETVNPLDVIEVQERILKELEDFKSEIRKEKGVTQKELDEAVDFVSEAAEKELKPPTHPAGDTYRRIINSWRREKN